MEEMAFARLRGRLSLAFVMLSASVVAWACGSGTSSEFPDFGTGTGAGGDDAAVVLFGGEGGPGDGGGGSVDSGCTGIACKRVYCPGGGTTSLSGTVVSPRPGDPDPIYNAIVYVPNAPVAQFTEGVTCDRCGAAVSGEPIAVALTGVDGKFVLKDIPVTNDLPVVIQLGRWRRQITISTVTACADTPLTTDQTRFPRNHGEGDIPKIALKTGDSDSPECVLRKMGIEDAEFTNPGAGGRIELYRGALSSPPTLAGTPPASDLLGNGATMNKYDLVLLPCDGNDFSPDGPSMKNIESYANLGGRIFASHYSYNWIKQQQPPSKWASVVTWDPAPTLPAPSETVPGYINTTFPKAQAMSMWLQQLGAADGGVIPTLLQPRRDIDSVNGSTLEWIAEKSPDRVGHFSFETPLDVDAGAECGRVVFNDFHTVNVFGGQTGTFPAECTDRTQPLTSQERVFEFMLFDLSSCVQKDDLPPVPPPTPPGTLK
jgi:hypothetical protein